jgi:glycosyltransferase involved in cell wall biosynthesis
MLKHLRRRAVETEDWLRYHPFIRGLYSQYQLWCGRGPTRREGPQALAHTIQMRCAAARLTTNPMVEARIQADLHQLTPRLAGQTLDWSEFVPDFQNRYVPKAAILKPYLGPREKGVLFIAFENQWVKVLGVPDVRALADRYTLVLSPSSSPHNLVNYAFPVLYPDPVFTLISNPHDLEVLPRISPKLMVVPLYASSWVNPELFVPLPRSARTYDLIMVANFAKFKRHQTLFAALRDMPRDLRLLLIGQDQDGRTAETIRELACCYGVAERFELRSNQTNAEVARAFCQARASVVLSRREGSCVAVAESLFADTPAALLQGAEIGSRVFLNEQTGRLLREDNLAEQLTAFVAEADQYRPRTWAMAHISCWRSSRILNEWLRRYALAAGQQWTQDIAPLQRNPDPRLARPQDRQRLAAERAEVRARFGLELGPDVPTQEQRAPTGSILVVRK